MRILVVMTGGTIGSVTTDGVTDVDVGIREELMKRYKEAYPSGVDFEVIYPYNLLSENLTPLYWETLYRTLTEVDIEAFDGIILTHGSDTLSYTSAMCAHLFGDLNIPLVLTAANHPLYNEKSNGLSNFHTCVTLITKKGWAGVFAVYQNDNGENDIYLAEQIEEADVFFGRFKGFGGKPFAKRLREEIRITDGKGFKVPPRKSLRIPQLSFHHKVLLLHSYPGLCYDNVTITKETKAVMLCLYHSSTACVEGRGYSALDFIRECKEKGVDVYLYYIKTMEGRRYATTEALMQTGGIPIGNMSKEAAYTKLLLAYNQEEVTPKEFFTM